MTATSATAVTAAGILSALIVTGVTLIISRVATRPLIGPRTERRWLLPVLKDADGWPSLARFQLFLWTVIVAFAILWVSFTRLLSGTGATMPDIPVNLLGILGIGTVATPIAAFQSNEKYGRRAPTDEDKIHMNHWHSMLLEQGRDGQHQPTLTRLQMFLWTWTGVVIYSLVLLSVMSSATALSATDTLSIPDLSQVFVGLMGLSQVGYIGGKQAAKPPEQPA